ncbi:hypothetical protein RJ640_015028 [Escallonia rubra]|uniref:Late embryogenesis abundant protein LEA-2 subgroup domain-containing protein n=1 Tax=Escallonia rubra TaxID=112253 RepID=A0AA88RXC2_9ASTE|nr:hypothetical protein RJ640_015028 [Escallonia rubra]
MHGLRILDVQPTALSELLGANDRAVAVIVTGIVVFVGYLAVRPKVPFISVSYAHLDRFDYDQAGILAVQLTIVVKAENDNAKAHAYFYDASFILGFHGLEIAKLVADPFDVSKNDSVQFDYLVQSTPIPLDELEQNLVELSLRQNLIAFDLKGKARTRWRVGVIGSVKFSLNLNCELKFFINGSSTNSHCSSRSK